MYFFVMFILYSSAFFFMKSCMLLIQCGYKSPKNLNYYQQTDTSTVMFQWRAVPF